MDKATGGGRVNGRHEVLMEVLQPNVKVLGRVRADQKGCFHVAIARARDQ